jgi:hypothetical protein
MLVAMMGFPIFTEFSTMKDKLYRRSGVPPSKNPPPVWLLILDNVGGMGTDHESRLQLVDSCSRSPKDALHLDTGNPRSRMELYLVTSHVKQELNLPGHIQSGPLHSQCIPEDVSNSQSVDEKLTYA